MTIEQAIQKAIEGGYVDNTEYTDEAFMDPVFWQCLGKGIAKDIQPAYHWSEQFKIEVSGSGRHKCNSKCRPTKTTNWKDWLYNWHRFIDHLAEGKSAESFFETLN